MSERLLRVLALYGEPTPFNLAEHPHTLASWAAHLRLTPNKATFYVPEERKERRRTLFKKTSLLDVIPEFKSYTWTALEEIVGGNFFNIVSHLPFETDASRYVVATPVEDFPLEMALDHVRLVRRSFSPFYGFCHVGPGVSAILFTSGISTTDQPLAISDRAAALGNSLSRLASTSTANSTI
jgi:hypothetical protein